MTDSLGADVYVADLVYNHARGLLNFLPAIIFLVGCLLAFAQAPPGGPSGIFDHPLVGVFQNTNPELMIISISAWRELSAETTARHFRHHHRGVCGSPVSILDYVMTQLPYAVTCAAVSFVTYIVASL